MPLQPVAQAAVADRNLKSVGFAMKDGSKRISVVVSNPALQNIEIADQDADSYFLTFKLYRKTFEQIASRKFDMGTSSRTGQFAFVQGTCLWRACTSPGAALLI